MDILSRIFGYIFAAVLLALLFPVVTAAVLSAHSLAVVGIALGIRRRWPSWALGMICAGAVQLGFLIATLLPRSLHPKGFSSTWVLIEFNVLGIYSFAAALAAFGLATLVTFVIKKIYRAFSAKRHKLVSS
jgi:hypothetical protein